MSLSRRKQDILIVAAIAMFGGGMFGALAYRESEREKKIESDVADFKTTGCSVVGDSLDQERYGTTLRNIYKCPDGKMYIR